MSGVVGVCGCMGLRARVSMWVWVHGCMRVGMWVCVRACVRACVCVCVCVCVFGELAYNSQSTISKTPLVWGVGATVIHLL